MNNVSALSTALYAYRAVDNALTLFRVWPMRFQRYFTVRHFWAHSLGRRLVVVRGIVGRAFVYLLFQLTTNADNYGILL